MSSRRTTAAALGLAAAALVAYPVLRGYGIETGMSAAQLYARPAWLWSHLLGMAGFVLLTIGLAGVHRVAHRVSMAATALLLPYYGAETYGLHAIGRRALATGESSGVPAADMFRYEPVAMTTFGLGLLALLAVGVVLVTDGLRAHGPRRAGAWLTGVALATYLPQFFLPGDLRIAHGALLAVGLVTLAVGTVRTSPTPDAPRHPDEHEHRSGVAARVDP